MFTHVREAQKRFSAAKVVLFFHLLRFRYLFLAFLSSLLLLLHDFSLLLPWK